MALIAHVFSKLWTGKDVIRYMFKTPLLRKSFESQHAKTLEKLLKYGWKHIYHNFSPLGERDWLVKCESRFTKLFGSKQSNTSETLLKSPWQHFYHIFPALWQRLIWKTSPLVICEVLTLFVNTLTADNKYSLCNRENLRQLIQTQLPEKQQFFSDFVAVFLNSASSFEHFEYKDDLESLHNSENTDCKRCGLISVSKAKFQKTPRESSC